MKKTRIAISIAGKDDKPDRVIISGYTAIDRYGLQFVVHRPHSENSVLHDEYWKVSETLSGHAVGTHYPTRVEAIKEANLTLDRVGRDGLWEAVAYAMTTN